MASHITPAAARERKRAGRSLKGMTTGHALHSTILHLRPVNLQTVITRTVGNTAFRLVAGRRRVAIKKTYTLCSS